MWKQSYNACLTVLYSIDIGSVSVFTVQIDDTSDETGVSATANVWLILCATLVCMLFSSKLVMVVVSLKEICEFIITYNCSGILQKWDHGHIVPLEQKVREPPPLPTPMDESRILLRAFEFQSIHVSAGNATKM